MGRRRAFELGGVSVAPGSRTIVDLPFAGQYNSAPVNLPVHVQHGRKDGPVIVVSGAVHGDEINGVEIIRRLLHARSLRGLKGTLLAVPIVNVLGFLNQSRYLPDRRDLNRSFPGSETGSLAGRLAHLVLTQLMARADIAIDLHTAAVHRDNLPQIRADLSDPVLEPLARAFGAPAVLSSGLIEGSLRHAANDMGVPVMVYEAGEALRYDEVSVRAGVDGVVRVMRHIGMLPPSRRKTPVSAVLKSSRWVRADESGILRAHAALGAAVQKGDVLGIVSDPFGEMEVPVLSPTDGVVIGRTNMPLVHEGEALFHIGRTGIADRVEERVDELRAGTEIQVDLDEPQLV